MLRAVGRLQTKRCFNNVVFGCGYHSYPEPDEKPIITATKSEVAPKRFDKTLPEFKLKESYGLSQVFPGTPISKGIIKTSPPKTVSTILANGLTVATQEMPGMMSSFALLVRTGR